jgi:aldose 1-epimerase
MRTFKLTKIAAVLVAAPLLAQYSVHREGDLITLQDAKSQTTVSIIPSIGNAAIAMKVKGQDVLRFPYASVDEFKGRPGLAGIPFLGPWANRLDETAFYANGKKYNFNMDLGNVRGPIPIHGFLSYTKDWQVVEAKSDKKSAWVTSRLEFFRHPEWMAQFPFAHTIQMTYRLADGVLEVNLRLENMSTDPMPVAVGFHPYYQLTDSPRDEWTISVGARTQYILAPNKIPTGETRPIEQLMPNPQAAALKDYDLDHVFGDLVRDASGRATMSVKGKSQKLEVMFGPNYHAAVIYAPNPPAGQQNPNGRGGQNRPPQNRNFICFEPMPGITDAMNLSQKGLYKELQSIPPGQTWQESFWVRPSGF